MEVIHKIDDLRQKLNVLRCSNKTIGFVGTMGFLHQGHISLMKMAKQECDIVVVSIFVNPLQFAPNEDLANYPRDLISDTQLCVNAQVDFLFMPEANIIINEKMFTYVNVNILDQCLCGAKRVGHFKGVCTIITKLFNIVNPDKAYFGEKDIQQLRIIQALVKDLNFAIQIIPGKTVRDYDGLALSSRNSYLSVLERKSAVIVPQTIKYIVNLIEQQIYSVKEILSLAHQLVSREKMAKVDYIEIVDNASLQPVTNIEHTVIIALAIFIGTTRLIDNQIYVI